MLLDTKQTHKRHNARCPHGITVHSNFKEQEKLAETETHRIKITLSSGACHSQTKRQSRLMLSAVEHCRNTKVFVTCSNPMAMTGIR